MLLERGQTDLNCTLLQTHQPAPDLGQDLMDSFSVPHALLLGNADVDQAPILPGSMDKSATVFRVDCFPVGLLRKGQRTEATQKPFTMKSLQMAPPSLT